MRGLKDRRRTLILFTDETIISETPPLKKKWTRGKERAEIPITGSHDRRILYGTINIHTGDMVINESLRWNQDEYQDHLENLKRAVENKQLEVVHHEIRDLRARMKACHRDFK